ncbi:hypothetical protein [Chondromyces crocatus]|uniref:Uncharacterized protein n=1 Tax=Chondromyces crocatus TaxID=52 RepID=A0A0K1E789_CHOCO|nr:hypothetical protein [Chondromyces crocatus]AKT36443.1 uncharacterized protein CMC5_005560 [Chondromyces crocatus]
MTSRQIERVFLGTLLLAGCEAPAPSTAGSPEAGTSPNASILPAPLASETLDPMDAGAPFDASDAAIRSLTADERRRPSVPDGGAPPPVPFTPDTALPAEASSTRDLSGLTLEAAWRWRDVPPPPRAPEVAADGIKAAQRLTTLSWSIDLSETGRLRIRFTSRALPLPGGSELRARSDRYGAIVLWPNATDYRVIPPGALRTTLGERRVDVTPLATGTVTPDGEGRRLNLPVRKLEINSGLGSLRLEMARIPEAGEGGVVLCRALVELAGIDPRTSECQPGEVPLLASYAWHDGGGAALEVNAIAKRVDLASNDMLVPPPGAKWSSSGLPTAPGGVFLTREEIAAFRSAPLDLPPPTAIGAPGEGFIAVNQLDTLHYLLLDGVAVVAVPPVSERYVIGTTRGRYHVQWRTFLGEFIGPVIQTEMPARLTLGDVDAGAPDGG